MRIGTKYEIKILRAEGLKRLLYEFPSSLSDFDAMDSRFRIAYSAGVGFDIANLAREQNLLFALPIAFYLLCQAHNAKELIAGIPRDDGTTAAISTDDLITCLAARESLVILQAETTFAWTNLPAINLSCDTPRECYGSRMQVMHLLSSHPVSIGGLDSWDFVPARGLSDNMCAMCAGLAEQMHTEGRVNFWNELPGNFGLSEWAEINKERAGL